MHLWWISKQLFCEYSERKFSLVWQQATKKCVRKPILANLSTRIFKNLSLVQAAVAVVPPGESNISKLLTTFFIFIRVLLFENSFAGPVSSPIHSWRYHNKRTRYWSHNLLLIEYLVVKRFPKIFFKWLLMLRRLFNLARTFLIKIFNMTITIYCHLFLQRTESSLTIGNKPINFYGEKIMLLV